MSNHKMKFYPKLNQYKSSNLVYDIEKEVAHSYEWYVIAKRINGVMVVNSYNYSNTTVRHYYKIRNLFDELNIDYVYIQAPKGLQNLEEAKSLYINLIDEIQTKINNPRSRKKTNEERQIYIETINDHISFINTLIGA